MPIREETAKPFVSWRCTSCQRLQDSSRGIHLDQAFDRRNWRGWCVQPDATTEEDTRRMNEDSLKYRIRTFVFQSWRHFTRFLFCSYPNCMTVRIRNSKSSIRNNMGLTGLMSSVTMCTMVKQKLWSTFAFIPLDSLTKFSESANE